MFPYRAIRPSLYPAATSDAFCFDNERAASDWLASVMHGAAAKTSPPLLVRAWGPSSPIASGLVAFHAHGQKMGRTLMQRRGEVMRERGMGVKGKKGLRDRLRSPREDMPAIIIAGTAGVSAINTGGEKHTP